MASRLCLTLWWLRWRLLPLGRGHSPLTKAPGKTSVSELAGNIWDPCLLAGLGAQLRGGPVQRFNSALLSVSLKMWPVKGNCFCLCCVLLLGIYFKTQVCLVISFLRPNISTLSHAPTARAPSMLEANLRSARAVQTHRDTGVLLPLCLFPASFLGWCCLFVWRERSNAEDVGEGE